MPDHQTGVLRILEAQDRIASPVLLNVKNIADRINAPVVEVMQACASLERQRLIKCVYGRSRDDNPECEITTFGKMMLERQENARPI